MQNRSIFVGIALAAVSACSDSNSPSNASGSVTFTFSGASNGTYSASGALTSTVNAPPPTASWAAGSVDLTGLFVGAAQPQAGNRFDLLDIESIRTTAGTADIDGTNAFVVVFFGVTDYSLNGVVQTCTLTAGTVVVTSVTATRLVGTFTGTGTCNPGTASSTAFTITGGAFDVPRLANVP